MGTQHYCMVDRGMTLLCLCVCVCLIRQREGDYRPGTWQVETVCTHQMPSCPSALSLCRTRLLVGPERAVIPQRIPQRIPQPELCPCIQKTQL